MNDPVKAVEEAQERHQAAGGHGPRWVPLAAAILGVLAALTTFVSNLRSTGALIAKNDAIVATARAADTYNEYEAGRIKYYVYQVAIDTNRGSDVARLRSVADREAQKGPPVLARARAFDEQAARDNERSERLLLSHEIIEIATTLFEVSIVLISITAIVGSRLLPTVAGIASAIGVIVFVIGLVR
ncbi:MAG TPA: DUF4337 family protein [Candidatus Limnocylindria bacterium]|jgi:hypothetical protein|nr:DUF4337 family protein [Candidatus Limnocylindria bacterium]